MPTSEAAAFAGRAGCLFLEASAKTAVGVTEAFNDVVTRIIDTPSLWSEEKATKTKTSSAPAPRPAANATTTAHANMPGNIDLSQSQDEEASAGCSC